MHGTRRVHRDDAGSGRAAAYASLELHEQILVVGTVRAASSARVAFALADDSASMTRTMLKRTLLWYLLLLVNVTLCMGVWDELCRIELRRRLALAGTVTPTTTTFPANAREAALLWLTGGDWVLDEEWKSSIQDAADQPNVLIRAGMSPGSTRAPCGSSHPIRWTVWVSAILGSLAACTGFFTVHAAMAAIARYSRNERMLHVARRRATRSGPYLMIVPLVATLLAWYLWVDRSGDVQGLSERSTPPSAVWWGALFGAAAAAGVIVHWATAHHIGRSAGSGRTCARCGYPRSPSQRLCPGCGLGQTHSQHTRARFLTSRRIVLRWTVIVVLASAAGALTLGLTSSRRFEFLIRWVCLGPLNYDSRTGAWY